MIEGGFVAEVQKTEVVVTHSQTGHIFRFPVLSNGTVSVHGSKIEGNPSASREVRKFVFAAYGAALAALSRSRSSP
jgi:hypothetical protein